MKTMFSFKVVPITEAQMGTLEDRLNTLGQQRYRVVGVIPAGTSGGGSIILEREEGPAAGAIRQQPAR